MLRKIIKIINTIEMIKNKNNNKFIIFYNKKNCNFKAFIKLDMRAQGYTWEKNFHKINN